MLSAARVIEKVVRGISLALSNVSERRNYADQKQIILDHKAGLDRLYDSQADFEGELDKLFEEVKNLARKTS